MTKDELIEAVWPETTVTDGVLKVSIRKLRLALDDDPKSPQFIETAHRRGYRFIGPIAEEGQREGETAGRRDSGTERQRDRETAGQGDAAPSPSVSPSLPPSVSPSPPLSLSGAHRLSGAYRLAALLPERGIVGREMALTQMQSWLRRALRGERQVVFVTGEAGIGKTTLVEAFLQRIKRDSNVWVGQGQCLDQYGAGEAYLPMFEAVSRLCQESGRAGLVELLRRHAPTWLQQMPWLIGEADRESLQRDVIGATRERMMREMAEALESLTSGTPLVLVIEDLHWSDYSTLDLVSYLARRRKPARLMLVVTYRPVEVALSEHPLKNVKQELQVHRQCEELLLEYFSQEAIGEYLTRRFPQHAFPDAFTGLLRERTGGNPFFLANVVDYLLAEDLIAERGGRWRLQVEVEALKVGVPENVRQMIGKQIERLSRQQQQLLEASSVAGAEFPAAAVAAALEADLIQTEQQFEEIERQRQFLRPTGVSELPDGTVTARYGFIHALYQHVLYERIAAGRRARLHQLIGERGERVYGDLAPEIAAELAMHFEQGRDYRRAVKYLRQAAQNHFLRYTNREALAYLSRALNLVEQWPQAEQTGVRIAMLEQAGLARLAMGDMAAAAADFAAIADYARKHGRMEDEVKAFVHQATALSWVDRERCLAAADRFATLSRGLTDELLQAHAHGCWSYWQVLFLAWGDEHPAALTRAIAAGRRAGDRAMTALHLARLGFFECLRSDYSAACRAAAEGAQLALESSDAHSFLLSQYYQAWALLHLGEWGEMRRVLDLGIEMAERNEHHRWAVLYRLELAWLHEQAFDFETARELCEQAHEQARAIGHPYTESLSLILLGMAQMGLERREEAFRCFSEAASGFERKRSLMDWILRIPLHYGLSRYWLAERQFDRARQETEALRELATPPGERTYLALAFQTLAEIAAAEQRWDEAETELSRAMAALEGAEAPLAAWRVFATAAQLHDQLGRPTETAHYRRRGAEALSRLAGSLGETDPLRHSLLNSLAARTIAATHESSRRS